MLRLSDSLDFFETSLAQAGAQTIAVVVVSTEVDSRYHE